LDAYRELNAKKLFWVSLIISGLIMLAIAAIGIHPSGFSVLWFKFEMWETIKSTEMLEMLRKEFYEKAFNLVGVTIWLTWASIILAIVSTSSMFPDLMSSGSIDTLLSKPISRFRLFMTKYCFGLGFVALQVLVFTIAGFLVIGFRASHWEPRIFLAVPIVVIFFSYLYAICTLVGVFTRSTLAAMLVTITLWFGLFAVNFTDDIFMEEQATAAVDIDHFSKALDYSQTLSDEPDEISGFSEREEYLMEWGSDIERQIERYQVQYDLWGKWRRYAMLVKTPLPKTGETRRLLTRALTPSEELPEDEFDPAKGRYQSYDMFGMGANETATATMTVKLRREQRPIWWVIITSLLFEVAVVGLAAWKFCRRDF